MEQIEANGRHDEQIHGGDLRRVIAQEGAPSPSWRSTPLAHVLGNARLRDLKPELEQFAVDTRCAPQRVLDAHAPDQNAQLRADFRKSYPDILMMQLWRVQASKKSGLLVYAS